MTNPNDLNGNGSISSYSSQGSTDILLSPIKSNTNTNNNGSSSRLNTNAQKYLVDLNKFRTNFGIMSFEEKEKVREMERKKKLLSIEKLKTEEEKRKEKEELILLGSDAIDFDFNENEEHNAIKKLKTGAASYDRNTSLHGFNVSAMAPRELKDLIRRIFNVTLTPKEFGGLCHEMVRPNGYIDIDKFLATFMHMRREHTNKVRLQSIEAEKKLIESKISEENVRAAKRKIEDEARLHHEHHDEVSLMKKMKKVAQMYV